ncbi:fimbria/pilus chaperone family protein [Glaciimonas sp. GG7]
MQIVSRKLPIFLLSVTVLANIVSPALASGMLPETSVVIINEADGEGSINVKNTDPKPALLLSSLESVPEDTEPLLFITHPVTRVEPGETQLVRFIMQAKEPIKVQRLKRVTFEGVPPKSLTGSSEVKMTVRQDLPVIIHPKGLEKNHAPWTLLQWSIANGSVTAKNDSPYVVRLGQMVSLQPSDMKVGLPRTYILPGETIAVALPAEANAEAVDAVRIHPATVYGYIVAAYDAPLSVQQK